MKKNLVLEVEGFIKYSTAIEEEDKVEEKIRKLACKIDKDLKGRFYMERGIALIKEKNKKDKLVLKEFNKNILEENFYNNFKTYFNEDNNDKNNVKEYTIDEIMIDCINAIDNNEPLDVGNDKLRQIVMLIKELKQRRKDDDFFVDDEGYSKCS